MCLTTILTKRTRGKLPTFNVCNHSMRSLGSGSVPTSMTRGVLHFTHTTRTMTAVHNGSCLSVNDISVNVTNSVMGPSFFRRCLNVHGRSVSLARVVHHVTRKVCSGRRCTGTVT